MDKELDRVMAKLDSIQEGVNETKINQAVMATKMESIEKRLDSHEKEKKDGRKVWTGFNFAVLTAVVVLLIETVIRRFF